jgi:hypothetical protein
LGQEIVNGHPYVFGDLSQKRRGYVAALMVWNGRLASIGVLELAVGAFLSNHRESMFLQNADYFTGFEHRNSTHQFTQ